MTYLYSIVSCKRKLIITNHTLVETRKKVDVCRSKRKIKMWCIIIFCRSKTKRKNVYKNFVIFLKKSDTFNLLVCKIINASDNLVPRASYLFDIGKSALRFQEVFMFSQLTAFFFRFIQVDSCSIFFYFHCYHYHLTSSKMNMYHLTFYFRIATYYIHDFHRAFFLTRCYVTNS